jgi:hypothetical protein
MLALPPPVFFLQQLPAAPDAGAHALHVAHDAPAVRMGTHGMVLFGRGEKLYASHIPMFHPPHDVQLLLQVELEGALAQRDFAGGLYTLEPERFDLSALMSGQLMQFRATLYQGNFEGGGKVLGREVRVRVRRVLHASALKADAPSAPHPRYLVLGGGQKDAFLVHALSRAPDFDQVLRVRFDKPLSEGVHTLELPGQSHTRLTPGPVKSAKLAGQPVRLQVAQELSYLKGPDFTP